MKADFTHPLLLHAYPSTTEMKADFTHPLLLHAYSSSTEMKADFTHPLLLHAYLSTTEMKADTRTVAPLCAPNSLRPILFLSNRFPSTLQTSDLQQQHRHNSYLHQLLHHVRSVCLCAAVHCGQSAPCNALKAVLQEGALAAAIRAHLHTHTQAHTFRPAQDRTKQEQRTSGALGHDIMHTSLHITKNKRSIRS
jgi:hypothetical protein